MPKTAPGMLPFLRRMDEFSRRSLRFPDYDILDARWSFYGVVDRCRDELRKAGREGMEKTIAHCGGAGVNASPGHPLRAMTSRPRMYGRRTRGTSTVPSSRW